MDSIQIDPNAVISKLSGEIAELIAGRAALQVAAEMLQGENAAHVKALEVVRAELAELRKDLEELREIEHEME